MRFSTEVVERLSANSEQLAPASAGSLPACSTFPKTIVAVVAAWGDSVATEPVVAESLMLVVGRWVAIAGGMTARRRIGERVAAGIVVVTGLVGLGSPDLGSP